LHLAPAAPERHTHHIRRLRIGRAACSTLTSGIREAILQKYKRRRRIMFSVAGLDHVALTVRDLNASVTWYREILGLERRYQEAWGDYPVLMCAGESGIALFQATEAGTHNAGASGFRHVAFRVSRADFDEAQTDFRARGIPFVFEDHGISHSVYLDDPDGYVVELTTYEVASVII
jgi:catechol 2,3-dioxygenase-like lactoylglutathione lyase family enzyme